MTAQQLARLLTELVISTSVTPAHVSAFLRRTGVNSSGREFVKRRRSRLFAVGQESVPFLFFRAGEEIVETGLYRVFHGDQRLSHDAVLCAGRPFPRCGECGDDMQFELLRSLPQLDRDRDFRSLTLYQIPHPSVEHAKIRKKAG